MTIKVGDKIETQVGGPYTVINIKDNLITFNLKGNMGIGMTIKEHITKIIKNTNDKSRTKIK